MIRVTKLNGTELCINSDLIEYIESTPDTTITMTTGHKLIVRETVREVTDKVTGHKREILRGQGPDAH
ncbi:MAG: flagellar FlbD family protein [Firmicutes bacterium]|nr:flagellar FlbD family protein [Bacillota bacterium]